MPDRKTIRPGSGGARKGQATNAREPAVPRERTETARRRIVAAISGNPLSARRISAAVGIPEREVVAHLEHIRRSVAREGSRLAVTPPECGRCGFAFRKRERLGRPGRCPVCRGESIAEPLFSVEPR